MSRVLLLATTTGYQTRAFGEAAARLGVELVFATDRCHALDDPWRDAGIHPGWKGMESPHSGYIFSIEIV